MDMAGGFEWFAQESIRSAELAHDRASVKSGDQIGAAHCRHEEVRTIGEDAAVYLSGDRPRAAQG